MRKTNIKLADQIKEAFLRSLESFDVSVEDMEKLASRATDIEIRSIFEDLGRAGRSIYLARGIGFINIHVRSTPPGWWNILKTVKEDMDVLKNELDIRNYYILLIGRNDKFIADGYITTDFNIPPFVRHPGNEPTKYSINEKQHLDRSMLYRSIEKVAKALLEARAS